MFEMYFLFVLVAWRFFPRYTLTLRRTAVWLAILLVPILALEYALHYARWFDDLVLFEVIEDVWRALPLI
jgi:hypothetical protein